MNKIKVFIVFGTRPEAIKLAPIIDYLKNSNQFLVQVCTTGQHKEMLSPVLELFGITPDVELDVMRHNQSLSDVLSIMINGLDKAINSWKPDVVIVQGDTASTLAGALTAFYRGVKIAYVEAGLRTGKLDSPFPEEANRKMVSCVSNYQFAPTSLAKKALLAEGYPLEDIFVVGNTSIDAITKASETVSHPNFEIPRDMHFLESNKRMILITGHRRENFGSVMDSIFKGFRKLALENSDIEFVYPVHLNPNVRDKVFNYLDGLENFHLLEPQQYDTFVWLMRRSYIIITDSGGIQEEAPSLNIPVIVTRNDTERMEAVHSGACILAGTNPNSINRLVVRLLEDLEFYKVAASADNPFGDGNTSEKIANILIDKFSN